MPISDALTSNLFIKTKTTSCVKLRNAQWMIHDFPLDLGVRQLTLVLTIFFSKQNPEIKKKGPLRRVLSPLPKSVSILAMIAVQFRCPVIYTDTIQSAKRCLPCLRVSSWVSVVRRYHFFDLTLFTILFCSLTPQQYLIQQDSFASHILR